MTTKAALERLDPADVRMECRAQIEAALFWGVDVTHLDAHMNVMQARDDLSEVYLDLALEFRLPVRMLPPQVIDRGTYMARERAEARRLLSNEHIIYPWPRRTRDVFFEEVPRLMPGVTEIFAHPVLDGEELRGYDVTNADIRVHDAVCLTDPSVPDLLNRHGVRRISFPRPPRPPACGLISTPINPQNATPLNDQNDTWVTLYCGLSGRNGTISGTGYACRSFRKLVSNSANTPSMSRKALPAAVPVLIGCSKSRARVTRRRSRLFFVGIEITPEGNQ